MDHGLYCWSPSTSCLQLFCFIGKYDVLRGRLAYERDKQNIHPQYVFNHGTECKSMVYKIKNTWSQIWTTISSSHLRVYEYEMINADNTEPFEVGILWGHLQECPADNCQGRGGNRLYAKGVKDATLCHLKAYSRSLRRDGNFAFIYL